MDRDSLQDLLAWRDRRRAHLSGPRGPWSITVLSILDERPQVLGSDADAEIPLPSRYPRRGATLRRDGDAVVVEPRPGAGLALAGQVLEAPTRLEPEAELTVGPPDDVAIVALLRRGARVAARVYDLRQGAARDPADLAWFEPDARAVVQARVERLEDGATLSVVNVLGDADDAPHAATLRFELGGRPWSLLAVDEGARWLVNFRDLTNGTTTYGAGRFLYLPATEADIVTLDFNRAFHPPCAHTPHATCPLPPVPNRIGVAVEAGERTAR